MSFKDYSSSLKTCQKHNKETKPIIRKKKKKYFNKSQGNQIWKIT